MATLPPRWLVQSIAALMLSCCYSSVKPSLVLRAMGFGDTQDSLSEQSMKTTPVSLASNDVYKKLSGQYKGEEGHCAPEDPEVYFKNQSIYVPCIEIFGSKLVTPCGKDVKRKKGGTNFTGPFGNVYHVDSVSEAKKAIDGVNAEFGQGTAAILSAIVMCVWVIIATARKGGFKQKVQRMVRGDLEDDVESDPIKLANRSNPESLDFIAPGNIYRVMSVLHPGYLQLNEYAPCAARALFCAFMQVYIPVAILTETLNANDFCGYKSPYFFAAHCLSFGTYICGLGPILAIFQSRCENNIRKGALANFWIMTHLPSDGSILSLTDSAKDLAAALRNVPMQEQPRTLSEQLSNHLLDKGQKMLTADAVQNVLYFWCTFSLAMNIGMSFVLQVVFYLKVATLQGGMDDTDKIILQAVSLYFVFDLETRIFDDHPRLQNAYRRTVLKLTAQAPENKHPHWFSRIAAMSMGLSELLIPFAIIFIAVARWVPKH